jgi:hypothetical protein
MTAHRAKTVRKQRRMTPPEAARRFVDLVLRITFSDVLDLADPHDGNHEANDRAQKAAYVEIETAVRRRYRVTHDLDALELAVRLAATEEQRDEVATAVAKLMNAVYDELTVKQQAGYVVGLAAGRVLYTGKSAGIGDGWTPKTP